MCVFPQPAGVVWVSPMAYRSLREAVTDLERAGQLVRISDEVDPDLEMAEIQRRVYEAQGPAVLFERVAGSPFPAVSNLFGTMERCRFLFRHTLARVQRVVELKADPTAAMRRPWRFAMTPFTAMRALPRRVRSGPVMANRTSIERLPQVRSWPDDGGPFITLPQVYTEDPESPGVMHSNLGMYRIQLAGNDYEPGAQVGLHYQLHRGIGVHHSAAARRDERLRVSIFVGGPPAHTFAAVMPLPEGLTELVFGGMLAGRRFRWARAGEHVVSAEADFCIVGSIDPMQTKPEGPFGDHLGYYSLVHPFPVLEVEAVYHRDGAIWPFTVVGRPPQEDTTFGKMIHELTAPMVPVEIPGLHAMHAVDAAGVHPLMLAIGSERYVPWGERMPQELLTIANAVLGFGQASLAKYLLIAAREDDESLQVDDEAGVLQHVLARMDFRRDLHFQTRTTMDTLDYSGTGLNAGSKVVMAAAGAPKRTLCRELPVELPWPDGFGAAKLALPGVLVVEAPAWEQMPEAGPTLGSRLADAGRLATPDTPVALIVMVDDASFAAHSLRNFLWVTFTRSNPSHDVHGVGAFIEHKHWGCTGALVIDARKKPHHAPPLVEDPSITRRVDALATAGKPLHGIV
jgi:4-hydroxy-3-polyprenylbenzoate decarboxylase